MLREPQKGQPITADWGREVVQELRRRRVFGGQGVRVTEGPDGVMVSTVPQDMPAPRAADGGHPRAFDMKVEDGLVKVSNTYVQVGDELAGNGAWLQIALSQSQNVLYAMIQRSSGGSVSISLAYAALGSKPETMDGLLFPVALYVIDSAGKVLCDLRGSNAVMYK